MEAVLESDCDFGSGSKSGCLFSGGLGEELQPSTALEGQEEFYAGLPSGHLKQGFAGDSGKQRLHPPGPEGAGRRPPRALGVCGFFPSRMSALLGE